MRLIPLMLVAAAESLASCGGSPDQTPNEPAAAVAATPLSADQQQARHEGCMKRMEHYQQIGVWKHGGAKPGVSRGAWEKLTADEQSEVFDIAACILASGQVGERMVTVAEEGNGPQIETRWVSNGRNFGTETQSTTPKRI